MVYSPQVVYVEKVRGCHMFVGHPLMLYMYLLLECIELLLEFALALAAHLHNGKTLGGDVDECRY